jgi:hypothetical protein
MKAQMASHTSWMDARLERMIGLFRKNGGHGFRGKPRGEGV